MNKEIMQAAGFGEEVKTVAEGKCPFCKQSINMADFKTELDRREYAISGLCKTCMDEMFG